MTERAAVLNLHLERRLPAPAERVYAAWIEPESLAAWWGPAGFGSPSVELDVREGGRYRIAMQPPEGDVFHLGGEFRTVDPPRRLAYTFVWEEPTPDDRETLVSLVFHGLRSGTRLVLDHSGFATEERYRLHGAGWSETLDRLEEWLATDQG